MKYIVVSSYNTVDKMSQKEEETNSHILGYYWIMIHFGIVL